MSGQTRPRTLMATAALTLLTGCAHNDVLVFGTSTTLGLNVQTAAATGAAPSIVLGYERTEAVWMPLVLNGRGSKLDLCVTGLRPSCVESAVPISEAMYRSTIIDGEGTTRREQRDTYSVFASLGANFNSSVRTADGANAGGGIAQFFATGNAALNISNNEALMTALKVGDSEDQSLAIAAAAFSDDPQALRAFGQSLGGMDSLTDGAASGARTASLALSQVATIEACARGGTDHWRWPAMAAAVEGPFAARAQALPSSATKWPEIQTALLANDGLRTAVLAGGLKSFQCPGG